nr:deaminase domain-containing protein [uncultured Allomuricauda sp.]
MVSKQKSNGLVHVLLSGVKHLNLWFSLQHLLSKSHKLLKGVLTAIIILIAVTASAQIYPVQVTPQLVPPYSFKLSDYQTTTSERLFVNVLLTDAQESGRRVRLKMYLEGRGLNARTVDFVTGAAPVFLDGGVNLRLTNLDLQPYFSLNNLLGITPQQYGRPLPEGRFDICFEVFDYFSGQPISRKSCTTAFLQLNEPPLLNLPRRTDLVTARTPQNILFNWTPRHMTAPAVQYEFTLKELWDTGIDPQASFLATPVLHRTITFATTLLYGPADTPLLEGKTYGWQVRAFSDIGLNETFLFRNNGLSEIYHFTYQADCNPPRFVISEAQNARNVEITWQNSDHLRYRVEYRKKGYGEDDWFGQWTQSNSAFIRNLEPGTTYDFRVGGECIPNGGLAFSTAHEFTTPTEEELAYYNCGIPSEVEITNQRPLQNLGVNEVFSAGDFPVTVQDVSGGNGSFSGQGFITVPYLGNTKITVGFENIVVNTDYQMIEGMVVTEYDPSWENIGDVDQTIGDIGEFLGTLREIIGQIFDRREEELYRLEALQDQLANEEISEQEFNEQTAPSLVIIEELDDALGEKLRENIQNSPYATEAQKEEAQRLKPTALASNENLRNEDFEAIVQKDADTRKRLEDLADEVALAEDEVFYTNATVYLLSQPDYINGLQLITEFLEYLETTYDLCREEGLKSYKGQGVVPHCLWKNSNVTSLLHHGALDPPFMAGVIDGLYQEVEGIVLLPKYLLDFKKAQYDLIYAYTASYLQCPPDLPKLNEKRAKELYRRMHVERPNNVFGKTLSLLDGIKNYVSDYQDQRCEDALKLRQEVSDLLEFLKERKNIEQLFADVEEKLENYWGTIYDLDNEARYHHGKLAVAAITFLVPTGATQLSKLGKFKEVLQTIKNFTKSQLDEFQPKFRRFMDGKLANGGGSLTTRVLNLTSDANLINRVKSIRQSLTSKFKKSGNFGYADVNIQGVSKTEFYAHSKIDELTGTLPEKVPDISLKPKTADEIYPWTTENSSAGIPIDRNIDTEYKILTELTHKIGDNPNVTGSIKLFTERAPCPSCSNVIDLFKDRYKLLDVEIIHNNGVLLTNF